MIRVEYRAILPGMIRYRIPNVVQLPPGLLDQEYSLLNFHTARILEKKAQILPAAILCFLARILTALPHHSFNL